MVQASVHGNTAGREETGQHQMDQGQMFHKDGLDVFEFFNPGWSSQV